MPHGLDLEITHHPLTMKRVVNLIIATERMKGSQSEHLMGTEFRDENLLNIMLDSIVEEQTVLECFSAAPTQYECTGEHPCKVFDSENKSLVQVPNSMELHAVMLQGGSESSQVQMNLTTYMHLAPSPDARPVALSIKDTNLYLSCHKEGDEPTLHLEEMDKCTLQNFSSNSDLVRFLFYKQTTGLNLSTLVSVAHSDWYISTAEEDNKPLEMCQENARRHRTFKFQWVQKKKEEEDESDSTCGCHN